MQNSAEWYDQQQAGLGEKFLIQVINSFHSIEANPLHYEEKFSKKFRFALVHGFPFVVVFKIKEQLVVVNAVFHTSRNPEKFRKEK